MSESLPTDLSLVNSAVQKFIIHRVEFDLQYCSVSLLCYDYFLTLGDEIEYVWRQKWRTSTLFYFLCRYGLISNILYTFSYSGVLKEHGLKCDMGYQICGILGVFGRIGILGVWGLRTYAIAGKSKWVLAVLGVLAATCIGLAIASIPLMRCHGEGDLTILRGVLAAVTLFFELTAFAIATVRVWLSAREMETGTWAFLGRRKSLECVLFQQGFIYILAVVALSVSALVLTFQPCKGSFLERLLNAVKVPLPGFLTARFIIQLRKWQRHLQDTSAVSLLDTLHADSSPFTVVSDFPPSTTSGSKAPSNHKSSSNDQSDSPPDSPGSIFKELTGDVGPAPTAQMQVEHFEEYQWDWHRMELEDIARMRKLKNQGENPADRELSYTLDGIPVPRDVENRPRG